MRANVMICTRTAAALGAAALLAAVSLPADADAAAPSRRPAPSDPQAPTQRAPSPLDMATLPHDAAYALSPQLAAMLGVPAGRTLDGNGLRDLRAAARPGLPGQATPPVGTTLLWPALDITANGGPIGIYLKQYTLRGVGDKIEVWVASGADGVSTGTAFPSGDCRNDVAGSTAVTDAQVNGLIREFDRTIYPRETSVFSTPPDRNGTVTLPGLAAGGLDFSGDGDHTVTLVDNVRDPNFYEFPENKTYVAGFYAPVFNQITDRNVMTIDAFDWAHRTGPAPAGDPDDDLCRSRPARPRAYEGVFAHEWQHLLQNYRDPAESTWINEGLSDYAISLVGYGDTRRSVFEKGAEGHIFCFQGYGNVKGASNPNPRPCGGPQNSLTAWEDEGAGAEVLADYGNAWSFMLFLADRYGQELLSTLHRDGATQGLASVQAALDSYSPGTKVLDVVHDFQLMNLVDKVVDVRGGAVAGIPRARVTTRSLDASVNLSSPTAYARPGAAANGADYVALRRDGRPGEPLRSVAFSGGRSVQAPATAQSVDLGGLSFGVPVTVGADAEVAVHNWHVSLVGLDSRRHLALVQTRTGGFTASWTPRQLEAFAAYPTVVAVVSHDSPDDRAPAATQYARYVLKVNGTPRDGG